MKMGIKKAAFGAFAAVLALSSPMSALAQEDKVTIHIPGVGSWVLVETTVCVSGPGGSVCHTSQKWEWRGEQQAEVVRCDTIC